MTNTTLTDNRASGASSAGGDERGGAIVLDGSGPASLDHVTIAHNDADASSGGIRVDPPSRLTIRASILAFNTAKGTGSDCGGRGRIVSAGHNLETYDTCGFSASKGDRVDTNPLLARLAGNGGPVLPGGGFSPGLPSLPRRLQTTGLFHDSPAIDSIPASACPPPATDERGVSRPIGASCDVGAFEGSVPHSRARCAGLAVTIQAPVLPRWVAVIGLSGEPILKRHVVVGTPGPDVIVSGPGNDLVRGSGGADVICAGGGDDRVGGGAGADRIFGGPGKDQLFGGPG